MSNCHQITSQGKLESVTFRKVFEKKIYYYVLISKQRKEAGAGKSKNAF